MNNKKKVALVAHDNMKRDLAEWVDWNWEVLLKHHLICTGTTGKMVEKTLRDRRGREFREDDVDITLLKSGPLGGDQQTRGADRRGTGRGADLLLGPDAGAAARRGRQSASTDRHAV